MENIDMHHYIKRNIKHRKNKNIQNQTTREQGKNNTAHHK